MLDADESRERRCGKFKSMFDADEKNKIEKQKKKRDEVRKINSELKSFQSTLPGTQMGVFAGDEQQIKMGDMGKAKQNGMKWVLGLTL